MNLGTKITIYKFTPQVFTLTHKHRYSFRIVANPLHEQVGPNGDNHLDGYGIDAPINPRQLHIKHLRACN